MKYDIALIASIEATNIDEARQLVYREVEGINANNHEFAMELNMADDSITDNVNQRIVILHPADTHSLYDVDEYNAALEKNEEG